MLGKKKKKINSKKFATNKKHKKINSYEKNSYEKNKVAIAKNKSTKNWSHMKKNPTITFIQLLRTKKLKIK